MVVMVSAKDFPLERWYREMRIRRIGEGPLEVQRHIIARDILRQPEVEFRASGKSTCRAGRYLCACCNLPSGHTITRCAAG